ncbi:MAG: hypothetical protein GY903_08415 [Fuerstiella sp.]|nr:hypothetical protein [Fuerstiella sp.]MCP4854502.1 hypothetical protein [Fuerstiella sp.]
MKLHARRSWLFGCFVMSTAALCGGLATAEPDPAVTSEQIEADWLRQGQLRDAPGASASGVTLEQDAAGGCDGIKNGKWGFHTENEDQPWWQVDLGESTPLDRVVLYNRCDRAMGTRNSRIIVLVSNDGKYFEQYYQHDGTDFLGHPDGKPCSVPMKGRAARFIRMQLPGKSYFHLDEIEIYAVSGKENIALHKPATQSSTSQWSVRREARTSTVVTHNTTRVIERGRQLAENLHELGADIGAETRTLEQIAAQLNELPADATGEQRHDLDRRARRAQREMSLSNPLLDFDEILFIKRAPGLFPHVSDQYYGWWSRGGGGIHILSGFKGDDPQVRCLTEDWPTGSFLRPDLSYDGTKVLFAWCKHYPHLADVKDKTAKEQLPEDSFYHIFEMNLDGTGVRQLTRGYYDDFDARYLPSGEIMFLSTRKGQALQAGKQSAAATAEATCPDSYVRCGGGNHRPVAVFTLHAMDQRGENLRAISAFENFEWTPFVANDGRVLYARWDYIDRFNGHFMSLWSTNPDGTNSQLVYGNYTKKPQCIFEARPIPHSQKLIFTATAHHSITGGSLALLDRNLGDEYERPLTRLTPEVAFPEAEGWPTTYYAGPHPLSEQHFLVAWSDRPLPKHRLMPPDDPGNPRNALGLYLYDAFGNLTLLHRDPDISSMNPIPIRPRFRAPELASKTDWDGSQEGAFLLQDVYQGMSSVERGSVKSLRVVGVPPKVQPQMNFPVLGVSREDPGKFVLGTVPVESDGSAYFRVPSGLPVFFQALDADGLALQTMRSLTYVQPNETLACVGCHESRNSSPPTLGGSPLATQRPASRLLPDPSGSWPLRYDELVQPVLDRRCVGCHAPDSEDSVAAAFDLTPTASYDALMEFADGDLRKLAFEKDWSVVGDGPARNSKLLELLTRDAGHYGVQLSGEDFQRLVVWMDTYAQRLGSYSDDQEERLRELRHVVAPLLDE